MPPSKLAVMQPYIFPYLGYFQLIAVSDLFVVYDDVQWINRGWINRNRILSNGRAGYITFPVKKHSRSAKIYQVEFSDNWHRERQSILRKIENSYRRAPNFEPVYALLEEIFDTPVTSVSHFAYDALVQTCAYLQLACKLKLSSSIDKQESLKGQERMLNIAGILGALEYINLSGGRDLYSADAFKEAGIRLGFIEMNAISYKQFVTDDFVANLSIIDVMMFNSVTEINKLIEAYRIDYS